MADGTILLAAGGTGGHLFPAEALAHELIARGWQVHLATDTRAGRYAGSFPAAAIHEIPSATIGSRNPLALARAFWTIWRGAREAGRVIGEIRPKAVVGFGGYPTLPPVWAATRRSVPTIIHEQNAVMGRANKALAPRVSAIAGGFLSEGEGAHAGKTVATGNPVRPAVIEAARSEYEQSGEGAPFRLLVFGGSQGAQFFSQAVPAAIALLPGELRARLHVTQQARAEDEAAVKAAYAGLGIAAEVSPFFTDMARRIAVAHLVVSRSGASTVSEIAAIGRPAILVPYPHALDHDQAANAAALARAGGAEICVQSTLSPEVLASKLAGFMTQAQLCAAMAQAARSAGKPDATRLLADLTEAIASGQSVARFKGRMQA
ncbi:MAG TPA: undecaprenyldiphospho-muramoylpentapeptide beta-N-acetylglucosaminyltransferase [Aquamicrobium sp.]|nr:undecaprenyldiphospho-muramoylpentapeptide beta-N-acetylglucosaminyltransferase [Aquamicrobium sp.]